VGRLILDTSLLVAGERGTFDPSRIAAPQDSVVPAIAVAEYLVGTLGFDNDEQRRQSQDFLDDVLALLPVEHYTAEVAEHHAALIVHARDAGRTRGAHDLIIAATARATKRTIVTLDARARFDDLPGVEATVLTAK
jgi:tRNA(fMet)-specific endonuclease VapC